MLGKGILKELEKYVESHLDVVFNLKMDSNITEDMESHPILESVPEWDLENFIKTNRKPIFRDVLFRFIDEKGAIDSAIYKKALIDRRHFSKIRSNPDYRIGRNTAIALAFALELDEEETDELLSAAGYSLSGSDTFDLIIQFCLERKIYDIDDVNQALDYFSLKPLG